jgi:hypothetical protein
LFRGIAWRAVLRLSRTIPRKIDTGSSSAALPGY